MKYAYRTPSGDGGQADHLSDVMEVVTPSQRLAFEVAESGAREDLLAVCLSTAIFVFCWLALDSVIDIITFSFFGALK